MWWNFFDPNLALLKPNPDFQTLGTSLGAPIFAGGAIDLTGLLFLGQFPIEPEVNVAQTEAALINNCVLLCMALGENI